MSVTVVPQLRAAPAEPVISQARLHADARTARAAPSWSPSCASSAWPSALGSPRSSAVWDAIVHYDPANTDHLVIRELRLPRTILGVLVGATLGLAGAVMQGVTRNPLADPGILGVNAGAALLVVIGISVFGVTSILGYVWFAFAGAAVASVVVYSVAALGREGATPVKLALAGAALSAAFGAVTTAMLLLDQATFDQFRFWAVGSLSGRDMSIVVQIAPFLIAGCLLALCLGRVLNTLSLGEDVARGLGANVVALPGCLGGCGGAALRRGHRGLRADRLRRADHPARGPDDRRPRLPVGAAVLDGAGADPAARRRHHRPGGRPSR